MGRKCINIAISVDKLICCIPNYITQAFGLELLGLLNDDINEVLKPILRADSQTRLKTCKHYIHSPTSHTTPTQMLHKRC